MTFLKAAEKVLREAGRPMRPDEIAREKARKAAEEKKFKALVLSGFLDKTAWWQKVSEHREKGTEK